MSWRDISIDCLLRFMRPSGSSSLWVSWAQHWETLMMIAGRNNSHSSNWFVRDFPLHPLLFKSIFLSRNFTSLHWKGRSFAICGFSRGGTTVKMTFITSKGTPARGRDTICLHVCPLGLLQHSTCGPASTSWIASLIGVKLRFNNLFSLVDNHITITTL